MRGHRKHRTAYQISILFEKAGGCPMSAITTRPPESRQSALLPSPVIPLTAYYSCEVPSVAAPTSSSAASATAIHSAFRFRMGNNAAPAIAPPINPSHRRR